MPLHRDYAEMIKGRYGQIVNSTTKREATALTAGEFLHHFAGDVPWAHLDIAGTAWDVRRPYFADKGATGYGVRLLVDVARGGALSRGRPSLGSSGRILRASDGSRHSSASLAAQFRTRGAPVVRDITPPAAGTRTARSQTLRIAEAARPTRRDANIPIAARPRASIGLGTPRTIGATISATRSGSDPLIRSPGADARPVLDEHPVLAEHDPNRRIALLHLQLDLEPERPRLVRPALHAALDDRHDRGGEPALGQRAEPHLGRASVAGL